jgi:uncharacterized membrane protein
MTPDDERALSQPPDSPAQKTDAARAQAFSRNAYLVFALAASLFIVLRLWRLTDSCLWFDELFSVHAARHTWVGMFNFVVADIIHPPLFYILLKLWVALGGESLLWLRLFPTLTSIVTIAPLALLCRELKLRPAEVNLSLVLLALNGYLIKYAQEVRMYSLLLLLAVCSLWLFFRYYNSQRTRKRHLAALLLINLLLVYTHYYGWLVVATEFFFLLSFDARRKLLPFSGTAGVVLLCFIPWAYAVIDAQAASHGIAQNIGWAARPHLSHVAQFYFTLNEILYYVQSSNERLYLSWSVLPGALVFGCPLLLYVWRIVRRRVEDRTGARAFGWLWIFAALPVALAFLSSWLLPYSIWGTRHLIIIAAPYLILCAIAPARLRPFWLQATLLILLCCWTFLSLCVLLINRDGGNYVWCAWEPLAHQLAESEQTRGPPLKIYAFEDLVAYHTWFALSSTKERGATVEVVKGIPGLAEDPAYFLPRGFDEIKTTGAGEAFRENYFWIAFRDISLRPEQPPLKTLAERGFEVGEGFQVRTRGNVAFLVPVHRKR